MKMNKRVLTGLIAAGILSAGTALANPFDDVPKDHWSYDAVQALADEGIVDGYGDGAFRGDKLMTRYEMAQLVGRAISRGKLAEGNDKDLIDRLSKEYADELSSLGIRMETVEKKTAGVQDLKFSHWFQMENSYGDTMGSTADGSDDSAHEYMFKYRLKMEKQISPKLSILHELETKTEYDKGTANAGKGSRDGVISRLAYVTYAPDDKTTMQMGKNAYWFAGGLLGDDFIKGFNVTRQLDNNTNVQVTHGRNWVSDIDDKTGDYINGAEAMVTYAGVNTKFGAVDFGAHYLTGSENLSSKDKTKIWAVTAGTNLGNSGVNLSAGYGENTEAEDKGKIEKLQLAKKLGKTDVFLQYWKQEANLNLPIENGNHTTFWWDEYGRREGIEGYRLIAVHPWSENSYSEFFYGDYKSIATDEKGKKFGFSLTFQY